MRIIALLMLVLIVSPGVAQEPPDLDKIEAELKKKPNDPMLNYRKAQALFAKGQEQEAIDQAAVALAKFKAAKNSLAWMLLGSIKEGNYKIDVHYNMGPKERADKKDGIVRPYSFRVWTTDAEPKLARVIDFEHAYFQGKLATAAVGEMQGRNHMNYGVLDPKSDFATVKKKVLEVVTK
jgi:hypothetical protein